MLDAVEIASFRENGFVAVTRPLLPLEGLDEVGAIFDRLMARIDQLPPENVHDLGPESAEVRTIPEVIFTAKLEPDLLGTAVFGICSAAATDLIGGPAVVAFDHMIAKRSHSSASTPWHQDLAYDTQADPLSANFWIPLGEVDTSNSCMRFVPGSHRGRRLLVHERCGPDAIRAVGFDEAAAVACPLPAGGFTVHQQKTLHSTGGNETDEDRRAWIIKFVREDSLVPNRRARARSALNRLAGRSGKGS